MIKSKQVALVYRVTAMIIAYAGLLALLGVFQGAFYINVLYYYTAQSNIMAIILFVLLTAKTTIGILRNKKDEKETACYFPRFSMICSINVMITFVIFWVLLVPQLAGIFPLWTFSNLAVHAITPLLCLIDYILFSEPRRLKYRDVYYVVIFPLCYMAASSIAGLAGHVYGISPADGAPVRFPYFFYDFDRIGLMSLVYITGIVIFFLIISHIFYFINVRSQKSI